MTANVFSPYPVNFGLVGAGGVLHGAEHPAADAVGEAPGLGVAERAGHAVVHPETGSREPLLGLGAGPDHDPVGRHPPLVDRRPEGVAQLLPDRGGQDRSVAEGRYLLLDLLDQASQATRAGGLPTLHTPMILGSPPPPASTVGACVP